MCKLQSSLRVKGYIFAMIRFFLKLLGVLYFIATITISLIAIVAALGFIHPAFDVFNHLQAFIFIATFACLLLCPLFIRNIKWQSLAISIAATGFLSSAIIVVPEIVLGIQNKNITYKKTQTSYKLLSHNLFGQNYDMERIAKEIFKQNPDFVNLQEYFPEQQKRLHPLLKEKYPYYNICIGGKRANIAIYSKIKFEVLPASICAKNDEQRVSRIFAKFIDFDGKPFVVGTTHLDWPMQVSKLDDGENIFEGVNLAFARKAGQYKQLAQAIKTIDAPLIMAADFNSSSWSYALRNFATNNNMKLLTRGMLTYPYELSIPFWHGGFPFRFLSLDHIMIKGKVKNLELAKGDPAGSDHNSIIFSFLIE